MKELFANYNQSLALKELGFDEYCMEACYYEYVYKGKKTMELRTPDEMDIKDGIKAPFKSQVFKWFREKHDLFISINHYDNGYSINDLRRFDTYEEAEDACIDKLIELIKS